MTVSPVKVSFYFLFPIFGGRYLCTDSRCILNNTDGLWITRLQHAVQMVTTSMKALNVKKFLTIRVGPGVLMANIEVQMGIA
jgi:hypothetical protein